MNLKIQALKLIHKKCPECVWENYKVLLNEYFKFLRCKSRDWMKG